MTDVPVTDVPATASTPEPEPMVRPVAPLTVQLSVLGCPGSTFAGDAAKREMAGRFTVAARAGPIGATPAHRRKITVVFRIVVPPSYRPIQPKFISYHFAGQPAQKNTTSAPPTNPPSSRNAPGA